MEVGKKSTQTKDAWKFQRNMLLCILILKDVTVQKEENYLGLKQKKPC